jgi:hypothetical protein
MKTQNGSFILFMELGFTSWKHYCREFSKYHRTPFAVRSFNTNSSWQRLDLKGSVTAQARQMCAQIRAGAKSYGHLVETAARS